MEKNFLKDVIPPAHQKSVRDIPLPNKTSASREGRSEREGVAIRRKASAHVPPRRRPRDVPQGGFGRKKSKLPAILIGVFGFFLLAWIYGVLAHSAQVSISTEAIPSNEVDGAFTIYNRTNPPETVPQSFIPYTLQTLTVDASQEVQASGREEVEDFATGTIKITKTSAESQPLIKNTRFESEDGRIYRVRNSIVVPGAQRATPGTKEVEVFADQPGEEFNLISGKFTVPGLSGLPEFDEITAETVTAIAGGFTGVRNVVSEEDEDTTRGSLQTKLEEDLLAKIGEQIAEEKIFYYTPSFIKYTPLPSDETGEKVLIREKGVLQGLLFDKKDITNTILKTSVAGLTDIENVKIANIDSLSITLEDKETFEPEAADPGTLLISGLPQYSWGLTEENVGSQIAGLPKKEADEILLQQSGVRQFVIKVSPFWKKALPGNVEDISVTFGE